MNGTEKQIKFANDLLALVNTSLEENFGSTEMREIVKNKTATSLFFTSAEKQEVKSEDQAEIMRDRMAIMCNKILQSEDAALIIKCFSELTKGNSPAPSDIFACIRNCKEAEFDTRTDFLFV